MCACVRVCVNECVSVCVCVYAWLLIPIQQDVHPQ